MGHLKYKTVYSLINFEDIRRGARGTILEVYNDEDVEVEFVGADNEYITYTIPLQYLYICKEK